MNSTNTVTDKQDKQNVRNIDEQALIKSMRAGDADALKVVMEHYQNQMFNTAYRLTGSYEDAREVTQDVFIKLFQNIHKFRGESSLATYLYRIAMNLSKNVLRSKRRHQENRTYSMDAPIGDTEQTYDPPSEAPLPNKKIANGELLGLLEDKLDELSFEFKQIIVMRFIDDLSYEEMSKVLECSIGTIKSRIHRAKSELKNKMRLYLT